MYIRSLPVWECGLKFLCLFFRLFPGIVTPRVGVWIEIYVIGYKGYGFKVTPCVGVWIEIITPINFPTLAFCHSLCGSVD